MSTCVSRDGEYSEHKTKEHLWCDRCFAYDEAAIADLLAERDRLAVENTALRKVAEAAERLWLLYPLSLGLDDSEKMAYADLRNAVREWRAER